MYMKKNSFFSILFRAKFLFLSVSMLAASISVFGQATTGTLRGIVNDPNGALVPGASVVARNEATGVSTVTITTTEDGEFVFTNLLPGTYSVLRKRLLAG
jgi:uncharacterized surface anchored protein